MGCCKRIVALRVKCQECGRDVDYVCDAKMWDGVTHADKDAYAFRTCSCKNKIEVSKEMALKHVFIKEGAVLG